MSHYADEFVYEKLHTDISAREKFGKTANRQKFKIDSRNSEIRRKFDATAANNFYKQIANVVCVYASEDFDLDWQENAWNSNCANSKMTCILY